MVPINGLHEVRLSLNAPNPFRSKQLSSYSCFRYSGYSSVKLGVIVGLTFLALPATAIANLWEFLRQKNLLHLSRVPLAPQIYKTQLLSRKYDLV